MGYYIMNTRISKELCKTVEDVTLACNGDYIGQIMTHTIYSDDGEVVIVKWKWTGFNWDKQ